MFISVFRVLFLIFSIFTLLRVIGYGIYELKTLNNKSGGITVILFSVLVVIFANIMVWIN